jgi:two-component system response regulator AdeR
MTEEPQTILVADDEPEIADLYATWLRREHEVRTAYGGAEALEQVDESVDIVFLDRRMPRMTGDEVLAELRERGLNCRVVLMTAVDPDFDIIDIDFDAYLTKPVMRDDIEGVIQALEGRPAGNETVRKYCALVSKRETLEAEKTRSELEHSDDYQRLVDRIETLAAEADISHQETDGRVSGTFSDG